MMKKTTILLFVLATALTAIGHDLAALNEKGDSIWLNHAAGRFGENDVYVTFRGTWYGATKGEYKDTFLIPDQVTIDKQTYRIVGIGEQAFSECSDLLSITIPESIQFIANKAFQYCYNLGEVNYNAIRCDDLTLPEFAPFSFGNMAFGEYVYPANDDSYPDSYWSKYKLRKITIGENVERVPDYMFYGMGGTLEQADFTKEPVRVTDSKEGVTEVIFLGTPREIGNQAFRGCRVLRTIALPEGVESLGQALFADCDTLAEVELPAEIEEIPAYFFMNCKELEDIDIPETVRSINYEAFKNCVKLSEMTTLPNGLTTVGPSAFRACTNLQTVLLPESLTEIGGYAFSDCTSLTEIDIPAAVASIGNYAFEDCTNLATVSIHDGTEEIGNFVFSGCRKLSRGVLNAPARAPRIYAQTFQGVDNTMTVRVEGGDCASYLANDQWKRFFTGMDVQDKPAEKNRTHKFVRDGQVLFFRDGKIFDILGNEI